MTRKIDQYHPSRVVDSPAARWMPPKWRNKIQYVIVVLAWYGAISSAVSILSNLTWLVDVAKWLYGMAGAIKPLLQAIATFVHAVVTAWRVLTAPLHGLLFGWLPFKIPREILDGLIIGSTLVGGYVKSCLATAQERRLMAVFSDRLSMEGRIATIKRIQAANYILAGNYSEVSKDKAEIELAHALEEMGDGVEDRDFAIIEAALDMTPEDLDAFLIRCAVAEEQAAATRAAIVKRSRSIASVLGMCVLIDFAYRILI